MIRFTEILCPIDFSEFSRRALDHAAAIARRCEARLTVLYVSPSLPVVDLPPIALEAKDRERLTLKMKQFTAHLPSGVPVEHRIEEAPDIHQEILGQAASTHADLLVLGSHGRSGFDRLVLGSVTEKLLRRVPCPTMVVPPRAPDASPDRPVQFLRVLCPVDFSAASTRAVDFALGLAGEAEAQVVLLHVIEVPPELQESHVSATFSVENVRAAAEADRLQRLRALIPEQARSFCTVETSVREGAAYREILKVAAERKSDLIVMGVQGRGAIDLMVFGSNTARVVRAATCPVLIVRHVNPDERR
jgi:nucleotide-binding universal stress UspA family protein